VGRLVALASCLLVAAAALGAAAILALSDAKLAKKLDGYRAAQTKAVLDNPIPGRKGKKR